MRARSVVAGIAMDICTIAIFGYARAQDEPFPVDLKVGETIDVCASGLLGCPTIGPRCDDPNIAIPVQGSGGGGGFGFRGVGPGTTLFSATSPTGFSRIFRITVR